MDKSGWSFCIVTAPNNHKVLSTCIDKIVSEFKDDNNFEIIVVGNTSLSQEKKYSNVRFLEFSEEIFSPSIRNIKKVIVEKKLKRFFYKTGAISHKKNLAAKNARFDKLCIMHDYVGLEANWLSEFKKFGDQWQICVNPILDIDGKRHRDWMSWDYPGVGPGLLPYDAYTKYMYISGTYFCVKREFFIENQLNEKHFWGEGEDVEWSLRVRDKTKFMLNKNSVVKYLKAKPKDDCPNCPSWQASTLKLESFFKNGTL